MRCAKCQAENRLVPAYCRTLALVAAMRGATLWVGQTRYGLALRSIKDDEEAAGAFGIDTLRIKRADLVASAAMAGLTGGIYGAYSAWTRSWDPW